MQLMSIFYDQDGKTALVIAAENGYLDIVKLLCVKGAKLDAKGKVEST